LTFASCLVIFVFEGSDVLYEFVNFFT